MAQGSRPSHWSTESHGGHGAVGGGLALEVVE